MGSQKRGRGEIFAGITSGRDGATAVGGAIWCVLYPHRIRRGAFVCTEEGNSIEFLA